MCHSNYGALIKVAHFNLRERYLPYKNLIASVIIDKNPSIKTVVNKTEFLGEDNKFRVLPFELLGGEPNYEVCPRPPLSCSKC